jgi:hypothetical protein
MSLTDWQDLHSLTYLHYCLAVCQLTLYCLLPRTVWQKKILPWRRLSFALSRFFSNHPGAHLWWEWDPRMCGSCWHESLDLWHQRMAGGGKHTTCSYLVWQLYWASRGLSKQAPVWTINLVFSCSSLFYVVPILLYRQLWVFLFMPHTQHHPFFEIRASSFTKSSSAVGKDNLHYGPHHSFTSRLQNLVSLEGYKRKILTRKGMMSKHDFFLSQNASVPRRTHTNSEIRLSTRRQHAFDWFQDNCSNTVAPATSSWTPSF